MRHRADSHAIAGALARGSTFPGGYNKVSGSQAELEALVIKPDGIAKLCSTCVARQRGLKGQVPSGSKYSPLRDFLAGCIGGEVRMTFAEVEGLVGHLPDSARLHRAWWSNSSHIARAWQDAGWHLQSVNQTAEQAVFVRGTTSRPSRGGNEHHASQIAYVDAQVISAIKAHQAPGRFDSAKLLRLIDELNDNYVRGNTYAVHTVLRAILDHIPPLLGCSAFTAVANNYPWSRTDKAYMKRLLDFRLQADDALHRQISAQTDLLSLGDIPPRAMINRLLQECASPSGTLKVARHDTADAARPRQSSQGNASRPNAIPGQASTSLPTSGPVPQESGERIVIRLTQGGLDNNYLSLAKHLNFFPTAAIGAPTIQDGEGTLLTLHFAGLPDTVETDIADKHKFFRRRDPWRRFFALHRLVEGDSVAIERLSPYEYRVVPLVSHPLEPGSRLRRLTDKQASAWQAGTRFPGSAEFRSVIADAPAEQRDLLQRACDWAESLEQEGVATLVTSRGRSGIVSLQSRLPGDKPGLVIIYRDIKSAYIMFSRTVFERFAPRSISAVEAALRTGLTSTHTLPDGLLDALTTAYRQAAQAANVTPSL